MTCMVRTYYGYNVVNSDDQEEFIVLDGARPVTGKIHETLADAIGEARDCCEKEQREAREKLEAERQAEDIANDEKARAERDAAKAEQPTDSP